MIVRDAAGRAIVDVIHPGTGELIMRAGIDWPGDEQPPSPLVLQTARGDLDGGFREGVAGGLAIYAPEVGRR